MKVRDSAGTLRTITSLRVRDSANTLRTVSALRVRDSLNVLRMVPNIGGMTASASPETANGFGSSKGLIRISTESVVISVGGGTPPYTYSWAPSAGWDTIFAGSSSTPFRSPAVADGDDATGSVVCTITDARSQTATASAALYATNTGF